MSRRRTQKSTLDSQARAARRRPRRPLLDHRFIEALEERCLFTTVITDTDPLTAAPSRFEFEYKDHDGAAVRVVVVGDVSAEFIFARVTKGSEKGPISEWNNVILGEHVAAGSKEDGRDLFHIYVAQASIDSYISIAEVPVPGDVLIDPEAALHGRSAHQVQRRGRDDLDGGHVGDVAQLVGGNTSDLAHAATLAD